jgi:transposase-like protein
MEQECKKCGSDKRVKNGVVRGLQRYKCKRCGCNYTFTKRPGVHPALRAFAVVLYGMCGVSMNKIGKLFKVSNVAVLKWIRREAEGIRDSQMKSASDIVMIDEMWHFVNGKKRRFGSGEPLMAYRVDLLDGNWAIVAIPALKG